MATEFHHNSAEQVREYLSEALAIVNDLELSDDLRGPAFVQAVGLLSAKQITLTPADVTPNVLPAMAIPGQRGH